MSELKLAVASDNQEQIEQELGDLLFSIVNVVKISQG